MFLGNMMRREKLTLLCQDHEALGSLLQKVFLSHRMVRDLTVFFPTQYLYFPLRARLKSIFTAQAITI